MRGTWRLSYRPELDGVRAFAVAVVLLAHAHVKGSKGGSYGVDVFFVLSGFLITSLLVMEIRDSGRVSLPGFWRRRAVRLLPALYLLIGGVIVFDRYLGPLGREVAWAPAFYVTNWYQAGGGQAGVFTHMWSLAIEEQFYLVWPLVLVTLWKLDPSLRVARWFAVTAVLAVVGVRTLLVADGMQTSRWYFDSFLRADALMMGCALGLWFCCEGPPRWTREGRWIAPVGIATMIFCWACLHRGIDLKAFDRALVALAAVAIIGVATASPSVRMTEVLAHPVAVWIGRRSYGIYLYHYPLFHTTIFGGPDIIWEIALTLVVADLSYRYIEQPLIRRYRHGLRTDQRTTPTLTANQTV